MNLRNSRLAVIFKPWPIRPLPVSILLTLFQLLLNSAIVISSARSQGRLASIRELWAVMPSVVLGFIFSILSLGLTQYLIGRFRRFEALLYWSGAVFFGVFLAFARYLAINDLTPAFWRDPVGWGRIFVVSILIFQIVHVSLGTANQRLAEQVARAEAATSALEIQRRRLITAGEDIRKQISDFLHDRLQSDLVLLGIQMKRSTEKLSAEQRSIAQAYIDEIERIRQFDVRDVSRQLAPELDGPSIRPPLEELLSRYEKVFPYQLSLIESGSMPKSVKLACYRIVEQALLNAAKHGQATEVKVEVVESESEVKVSISNNGYALKSNPTAGAGFAMFEDWTRQHHGYWEIRAGELGTQVIAVLRMNTNQ